MRRDLADLIDGGIAGCAGTASMSAVMIAASRAGLLGRQPPERVAEEALGAVGIQHAARTQDLLAVALHFGFGAAMGALFGLLHRRLTLKVGAEPQGLIFGTLVWATSYKGWLPALGIMPPPERDRPGRPQTMILAHWVYGWTLGRSLGMASGVRRLLARDPRPARA